MCAFARRKSAGWTDRCVCVRVYSHRSRSSLVVELFSIFLYKWCDEGFWGCVQAVASVEKAEFPLVDSTGDPQVIQLELSVAHVAKWLRFFFPIFAPNSWTPAYEVSGVILHLFSCSSFSPFLFRLLQLSSGSVINYSLHRRLRNCHATLPVETLAHGAGHWSPLLPPYWLLALSWDGVASLFVSWAACQIGLRSCTPQPPNSTSHTPTRTYTIRHTHTWCIDQGLPRFRKRPPCGRLEPVCCSTPGVISFRL